MATVTVYQGAHARLSPSSAKIWLKCAAAPRVMDPDESELPIEEWTAEGQFAHDIVAQCIQKGRQLIEFAGASKVFQPGDVLIQVTPEMLGHMQLYLDEVYGYLPADCDTRIECEMKVGLAPIGRPDMFGTLDCAYLAPHPSGRGWRLHIFDLKFGEGIWVPADDPQFPYYAAAFLSERPHLTEDLVDVMVHVVQPRIDHMGPKVRHFTYTAGELGTWLHCVLLPGAERTEADEPEFAPDKETCRFCSPVRCPVHHGRFDRMMVEAKRGALVDVARALTDEELGDRLALVETARKYCTVLEQEDYRRQMTGRVIPGRKLVETLTHRKWKPDAEKAARDTFGDSAFEKKMLGVPAVEKLPGGAEFVKAHAFKPIGRPTSAPASDSRPSVKPPSAGDRAKEAFGHLIIDKPKAAE